MEISRIENMRGGWFIGDFEPTLMKTNAFEVAVKKYTAGQYEKVHFHIEAVEFTLILNGEAEMNGHKLVDGDIVRINRNYATDFKAITDVTTVVVKMPSVANDKFFPDAG